LNNSPARWLALPRPIEPYDSFPGLLCAATTNSFTVAAGTAWFTVSAIGAFPISPTGAKSAMLS
jgi:hypothetical protein